MNDEQTIHLFAKEIDYFIKQKFRYKKKTTHIAWGKNIQINRKKASLYLRYKPANDDLWPKNSLVIASIGFEREREGSGTSLLKFLVNIAPKFDYSHIGIECTHDGDCIQNFVRKYGFSVNVQENHWLSSVNDLQNQLAKTSSSSS